MDYFTEIARNPEPGPKELDGFLVGLYKFFYHLYESPDFQFLWEPDPDLRKLFQELLYGDLEISIGLLRQSIPNMDPVAIRDHGLEGRSLHFKLRVIDLIFRDYEEGESYEGPVFSMSGGGMGTIDGTSADGESRGPGSGWFESAINALDALLDSLISVAGVGGNIKEIKDMLLALSQKIRGPRIPLPRIFWFDR